MYQDDEIKTYAISSDGKVVDANITNDEVKDTDNGESVIETKEQILMKHYSEVNSVDRERIINSNPFMVKAQVARSCNVESIEDFKIKIKRKDVRPIKEVLRTQDYKYDKRKKSILKAIKHWIKDFKENKTRIVLKASDVKEAARPVDIKKIKVGAYIFLPLGLAFLLIVYFELTKIWDISHEFSIAGMNMNLNFASARQNVLASSWVNIIAIAGMYLSVASMLFIGLYHAVCHEARGYSKVYIKLNDKLSNKINNDFNHKSKKTMKYYQKALHKKECKLDPLPIEETAITDVDFTDLEELSNAYMHKMAKVKGRKAFLYITQFILFKGSYLCATGVLSYVLFELISGLFGGM